jgi:hypothetical protein
VKNMKECPCGCGREIHRSPQAFDLGKQQLGYDDLALANENTETNNPWPCMTNAEAIAVIRSNWPSGRYTLLQKALDMAIQALGGDDSK